MNNKIEFYKKLRSVGIDCATIYIDPCSPELVRIMIYKGWVENSDNLIEQSQLKSLIETEFELKIMNDEPLVEHGGKLFSYTFYISR